jgi:AcrR family transcriptional regulator
MPSHGDLGPDSEPLLGERVLLEGEVGHLGEEVRPVAANLIGAPEAPIGSARVLQHVVGGEVGHDAVQIVRGGGAMQASNDVTRRAGRVRGIRSHRLAFRFIRGVGLIRYSVLYLIRRILVADRNVKRSYDAARRRERAAERRRQVVGRAWSLFASLGYGRTTVSAVAAAAGVSPETIYKSFGGKAGLVRAIWQDALAGIGPEHAERRSDAMSAAATTGAEIVEGWVRVGVEVAPRAGMVLALVRTAADLDPEAARLLEEIERGRADRMLHNARVLDQMGWLRPDLSLEQARDLLLLFTDDPYGRLVSRAGWSDDDYVATMTRLMSAALLRDV